MFERFTHEAHRAVVLAQEEARVLNHNEINVGHLLLGLVHEFPADDAESYHREILAEFGLGSLGEVREHVRQYCVNVGLGPGAYIAFTPEAKTTLTKALRWALRLGQGYIDWQHLLIAITEQDQTIGHLVIQELCDDIPGLRNRLALSMGSAPELDYTTWARVGPVTLDLRLSSEEHNLLLSMRLQGVMPIRTEHKRTSSVRVSGLTAEQAVLVETMLKRLLMSPD